MPRGSTAGEICAPVPLKLNEIQDPDSLPCNRMDCRAVTFRYQRKGLAMVAVVMGLVGLPSP
jgi:hypothetical protein